MTLTIELTPEETKRVETARRKGISVTSLVRGLIAGLPSEETGADEDRTEALFAQWAVEDATEDPAEIEAAERELAEFKANMNANRALTGEEPLYK